MELEHLPLMVLFHQDYPSFNNLDGYHYNPEAARKLLQQFIHETWG